MPIEENNGTRSAGTEEKEVIVSKLSDLVVGVWEKAGDKFRTKTEAEAKDSVVAAALTDLDTRLETVSGEVEEKADLYHSHGFLTSEGTINSAATISSGDHLVITDASELGKVKQSVLTFDGVSEDKALTKAGTWETILGNAAITNAINALDVSSVGGSGKYISAISETDGKISATATSFDSTPTIGSSNAVTSSGVKTALDDKVSKVANTTLNNNVSTTWVRYGERRLTVDGNAIYLDMSTATGNWAGAFAGLTDASASYAMVGFYGGSGALNYTYMMGSYSDPAFKITTTGIATFKNSLRVPSLSSSNGTYTYTLNSTKGGELALKEDVPAAVSVKGNAETSYRTGQVNLTPANLGISATTSSVTVGSTTFDKYTHPTTAGNKHVPSGGSTGQILGWDSNGTAKWIDTSATSAGTANYAETLLPKYITESSSSTWVEVGTFQSNTSNDMYAGITFAVEFRDNSGRTQSGLAWLSAGEYKGSGATYSNDDIICEYFTLCSRDQQFSTNVAFYANRNGTSDTSPITIYAKLNSYSSLILTPINAKKGHYVSSMTYLDSEPATKKEFTYRNILRTTHGTSVGSATTPVFVNSYGQVQSCTPSSMSVGSATTATNADLATSASHIVTQGAAVNSTSRHIWFSDANTETMRAHNDNFKYTPSTNTISANITGSASTAAALSKTQLGTVDALPISDILSSQFKAGTFLISNTGSSYTFGNVTIPKNQWYRFFVNGESANYCTITLDPCAGGDNTDMSSFEILVDSGTVRRVVRIPYATTTTAVGSSVVPAYVDSNGEFKACDPATMSVGFAAAAYPGSDLATVTAPDADTLVLQYQKTTSTATQFANAVNAYNSHKKLYAKWAGSYTSESSTFTYEQLIPLSYVSYTNTGGTPQIVMFSFKDVYDSITGGAENAGQIHTLHLDATQWTEASVIPYGAANATYAANAANADKWGGKALSIGSVAGTGYISFV